MQLGFIVTYTIIFFYLYAVLQTQKEFIIIYETSVTLLLVRNIHIPVLSKIIIY